MGVRKEGSGKSRSMANNQMGVASQASRPHALPAEVVHKDSDEDSDPELQEVYVQSYACQIFRDDAAAMSVEDGEHLRPLVSAQDPSSEPLMLDRFDARWMLDLADFNKEAVSNVPAKVASEERQADALRYAGLPSGDHSVVVEGLGRFAPSGSYAHSGNQRGLGDEEEEEPEVYGYYGRTASPPRGSATNSRNGWASTPAPPYSIRGEGAGEGAAAAPVAQGNGGGGGSEADNADGGVGEGGEGQQKATGADDVEEFVPDFDVPAGLVIPSSIRQHTMMVGTARTTVRSPQLEVLLRLKQQDNAAFAFLSDEDPIHPYYVFLKSWGEAALATEYARQQRLQAERADGRRREDEQRKSREAAAVAAAAAAAASKATNEDTSKTSDSDGPDAPNLLGGAYESSSEDEQESVAPAPSSGSPGARIRAVPAAAAVPTGESPLPPLPVESEAASEKAGQDDTVASPLVPGEEKRQIVEKMVGYVAKNGQAFEDRVRKKEASNSTFDFLIPENRFNAYYKMRLAIAKGERAGPTSRQGSSSGEVVASDRSTGNSKVMAGAAQATASVTSSLKPDQGLTSDSDRAHVKVASRGQDVSGGNVAPVAGTGAIDAIGGGAETLQHGVKTQRGQEGHDEHESATSGALEGQKNSNTTTLVGATGIAKSLRTKLGAKLESAKSADAKETERETTSEEVKQQQDTSDLLSDPASGKTGNGSSGACAKERNSVKVMDILVDTESSPVGVAEEDEITKGTASAGTGPVEDAETRRANRLKRARLMTGHYKLAVMEHSSEQQQQQETATGDGNAAAKGVAPTTGLATGKERANDSDDSSSANGLSDFDDIGSSDGEESDSGGDSADENDGGDNSSQVKEKRQSIGTRGGSDSLSASRRGRESSSSKKLKSSSESDNPRDHGRRTEDSNRGDRRREHRQDESSSHRSKASSGGGRSSRDKEIDRNTTLRDGKSSARRRSRSRSDSRGRGGGSGSARGDRRSRGSSRSDRERSSRTGDHAGTRDRKRSEREGRDDGKRGESSKSSRQTESRRDRGSRERPGGSRERGREQSGDDRRGSVSGRRKSTTESRHAHERDNGTRRRSRDREESRDRSGSSKRSRRR